MTDPSRRRSTMFAAIAVLTGGLGFAAGSFTAADAGQSPITKAQVKKISKKEAAKVVAKTAPTLAVGRARDAERIGGRVLKISGTTITAGGAAKTLAVVSGVSFRATCSSGAAIEVTTSAGGRYLGAYGTTGYSGSYTDPAPFVITTGGSGTGTFMFVPASGGPTVAADYGWVTDGGSSCALTLTAAIL